VRGAFWWIDRWRQSRAFTDMTAEEQGLYRNLCDELWLREDHVIPDDRRILARVSGDPEAWGRCSEKVLRWMRRVPNGWTNETALQVIHQSKRRAEKQKRYRDKTGNARGNEGGNKPGSPFTVHRSLDKEQETTTENDPVPLRGTPTRRSLAAETGPEFEVFAYWRVRCGRAKATWTQDRKAVLARRLSEEPEGIAGLKLAVDGAVADPLFNGSEKGTRYWDFENVFVHQGRNRIEKLQAAARGENGARASPRGYADVQREGLEAWEKAHEARQSGVQTGDGPAQRRLPERTDEPG